LCLLATATAARNPAKGNFMKIIFVAGYGTVPL